MTTDYRALCAELTDAFDALFCAGPSEETADIDDDLITRARAALAQPEPVWATREQIMDLADDCDFERQEISGFDGSNRFQGNGWECTDAQLLVFASAILTRYARPALTPIPVSERLPGAEDCDAEGRCWFGMWGEIDGEMIPDWELTRLEDYTNEGRLRLAGWLPAHDLPLPGQPAPAAPEP
jgi:hypothetical protein